MSAIIATTKVAKATIIPTIVPIPDALVQNVSLAPLLPCPEPVVAPVETLVVVGVLPEDTPLSLPSDEVPCEEDDVLEKKDISTSWQPLRRRKKYNEGTPDIYTRTKESKPQRITAVEKPIPLEFALEQDTVTYTVVACGFSCVVVAGTLTG
jgi:hypothetical protein